LLPLRDLKPGSTLGRYEILMPVARGGMANVWAARPIGTRGLQKLVAIKTMLPGLSDDPDFEAMFLDEARLAAKIHHPHVVEIVDLGDEDECVYLVMEWVNGETMFTLNKRAKALGGIPRRVMLRIAHSACGGLHAAHELRDDKGKLLDLVHRDVSPQNVMVSFDGVVKLVDFGVAKATGRAHETRVAGIMKGKVPYLSPEQLTGLKVDRRSDLFSLGILMYVMVSGRHPFRGESDARTMENICTRAAVPLRDLVPDVRSDLEEIVMRALEKDASSRWGTAGEMQRALDKVIAASGEAVNDGEVGAFVRHALGELITERTHQLDEAIQRMDARAASEMPAPGKTRLSAKRAVKGGAPLPATFDGIIPLDLPDRGGAAALSEPPRSAPPSFAPAPSLVPSHAPRAVSLVPPAEPRRSGGGGVLPYFGVGVLAVLTGAALGVRSGKLPWLADRLPPSLAFLAPPAARPADAPLSATTPAPPGDPSPTPSTATPAGTAASPERSALPATTAAAPTSAPAPAKGAAAPPVAPPVKSPPKKQKPKPTAEPSAPEAPTASAAPTAAPAAPSSAVTATPTTAPKKTPEPYSPGGL
jgi:eukaryotic-like serine/threonine-protein kinase